MDCFEIKGPTKLKGQIEAGGSKNCALPVLFATLLADGPHRVQGVPRLADMDSTLRMLVHFGLKIDQRFHSSFGADWTIDAREITSTEAPYDYVRKMRASILCLGPVLARQGIAKVSMPGGCSIGARPIDLHLMALEKLGAEIVQEQGYVLAKAPADGRLKGANIIFKTVSVGATENTVMAAVLAEGKTEITNAAREPEVQGLCHALKTMGAKIEGIGTSTLIIQGVPRLGPMNYRIPPDRIEVGTYLIGAQMTGGDVTVTSCDPEEMRLLLDLLRESGAKIEVKQNSVRCVSSDVIKPVDVETSPYPGFATDLQAQWITLMTQATGDSTATETIFENRFMHVPELIRMGADLKISGNVVRVRGQGRQSLQAAPVMATDLRASASLVLAALASRGNSRIKRIYHLDRGYETMEMKLRSLGAEVERSIDQ
jgi:UDP-N-acetylglucosamine 1-carboxyvinyltransferase